MRINYTEAMSEWTKWKDFWQEMQTGTKEEEKTEREREKRVFYGSEDRRHGESTGLLPFVRVIEQNSWST